MVVAGIDSLSRMLVGRNVENLLDDMRAAWDMFVHDSQLRWLGPEKGVEHMAIGRRAQRAIDPIAAATGEQMQNRIMYKQYLQAGSFKVMQIDATRVAGPQEIVLEYLLANKFGVRVCPPPTPAVSACARWCVTSPCSITWRSVDNGMIASSNMWTTSTNTSCIPLRSSMVVTRPRPLRARAST